MLSSHYPQFIKEYMGYTYVENEWGFVTFRKYDEHMNVEVGDLYTVPEYRGQNKASDLVRGLEEEWKAQGYKYMYTYIYNNYYQKEQSIIASLKYGMKIISQDSARMTLGKEI